MLLIKLFLSLILTFIFSFCVYSAENLSVSASGAILINAETLQVIFEKDAHSRHSMASTTKIMTSIIAIESGRLGEIVTAKNIVTEGTSIGLKDGYKLSLESLVCGMLLESGNDAAKLTADYLAGSEEAFADIMNNKADEIGMRNTNFVTASGLDDEMHYSTAYDMALLGAYVVNNPIFKEFCSAKRKTVQYDYPSIKVTFYNHNKLLSMFDGVFGLKTGFTKKSGRCLVSACERNGVTLIAVTLNAPDDWNDHIRLYKYGYKNIFKEKISFRLPEHVKIYGGVKDSLPINENLNSMLYSYSGEKGKLLQKVYLPDFLYAPIKKGEIIGRVELIKDGIKVGVKTITASMDIDSVEPVDDTPFIIKFFKKIFSK